MFDFLSKSFSSIFSRLQGQKTLTDAHIAEALQKVEDTLLEADVPYEVVNAFIAHIRQEVVGQKVIGSLKPTEQFIKIVHDKMLEFLGGKSSDIPFTFQIPSTVLVYGLQGAGKTTMLAKLAAFVQENAQKRGKTRRILLASLDFYRPAAIDQLEILAKKAPIDFYRAHSTDVVQAAQEICNYSAKNSYELLFLDTAGRLHIDTALIEELRRVAAIAKPKYTLLVLDSMTGQESLRIARSFEESLGFTGAILTKMDSDTRGGAAFTLCYSLKKPILFLGTGEKIGDLDYFRAERLTTRILGMGDVATLFEKAQEKIKQSDQERLYNSLEKGRISLQDFADQMDMVGKLGSMSSIMRYLPGTSGLSISPEMLEKGEREIKLFKAIINSMTPKERLMPKILDRSRKLRIAQGAGAKAADVDVLLDRFEQSQQFVKMFKKAGKFNQFFK